MASMNQMWFAKIRDKKKMIIRRHPNIDDSTGIYIIFRYDPTCDKRICYIGQAKKILERLAQHLLGYQAIDLSIKKHGLYDSEKNKEGYKFGILRHCDPSELDELEKKFINDYLADGWELKNITGGGQINKASDINQRKPAKGYLDGLEQGYKNCLRKVRDYFDKYLDFKMKEPALNKNGKINELKKRKYIEFAEFLEKNND